MRRISFFWVLIVAFILTYSLSSDGKEQMLGKGKLNVYTPVWSQSVKLYGQPHAIWLVACQSVGANLDILKKTLDDAAKVKQIPEFVVYTIPMRDLGQSSEGGFKNDVDYLQDNHLNEEMIAAFVKKTGIHPVIYLEPDSLPQAIQFEQEHRSLEAQQILQDRIRLTGILIKQYHQAGAKVYLSAAHSAWFDYGEEGIRQIAAVLNAAHINQADGLVTNISDRQPIVGSKAGERSEYHYLKCLLPHLHHRHRRHRLDVRVDTSRNGGMTQGRLYYLNPNGQLYDNEVSQGRLVGAWNRDDTGETWFVPFFGEKTPLSRLLDKEKYHYDGGTHILAAPAWLDAVGDVQPGPAPTDHPPKSVASVIQHYRYIKPPDDCDGALNYPPGASKSDINRDTALHQTSAIALPSDVWGHH